MFLVSAEVCGVWWEQSAWDVDADVGALTSQVRVLSNNVLMYWISI